MADLALEKAVRWFAVAAYLFGSAVIGGLRVNSDVDVLVVINNSLLCISGKIGNTDFIRPLEVTMIKLEDAAPWRYPPKNELIYGEWLRDHFERGQIQEPTHDPDLAIVLAQVRKYSVTLLGKNASDVLDPVPLTDMRRAIMESLPGLIGGLRETNVM